MALFLLSLALAAAAAPVPTTQAACSATPVALPAELAPWTAAGPLAAAASVEALGAARLTVGEARDLALGQTGQVQYALRPERPGGSVSHGGMAQFTVARAGIYRVALGNAAWLDVVADGKSLASVAHGHGPDCSGIRKMVDFQLAPGDYVLQVAGSGTPEVRVLVANVPAG